MRDLEVFCVFAIARPCTHTRAHAQCLIYGKGRYSLFFEVTNFAVWSRSAKTAKINTLENFPLYGNYSTHRHADAVVDYRPGFHTAMKLGGGGVIT